MLDRYEGHIAGLGTASGRRVVVGRWLRSPFGRFADVMTQAPDGRRTLIAPSAAVADEIASTYVFDELVLAPVRVRTAPSSRVWHVEAGPLQAWLTVGGRTPVGRLLAALPPALAASRLLATAADPVARRVLPGVRTRGSAGSGRREWYGASDQRRVVGARVLWHGADCGPLTAVRPPVTFGFSSVPAAPALTTVRTTIARPRP